MCGVYLEHFFSAKFAFSEHRISNFERRISIFLAQNLHFVSMEFPFSDRGNLEGLHIVSEDNGQRPVHGDAHCRHAVLELQM